MKTFRPQATSQDLEVWMRQGSRGVNGNAVVDAEGMFRAAGLGAIVDRAMARQKLMTPIAGPAPTPVSAVQAPVDPSVAPSSSVRVSAKVFWKRKRLTIVVSTKRRSDAVVKVRLERRTRRGYKSLRTIYSDSMRSVVRSPVRPARVRVWFEYADRSLSTPAVLRLTARGTYR